jgi:hypothetical protein
MLRFLALLTLVAALPLQAQSRDSTSAPSASDAAAIRAAALTRAKPDTAVARIRIYANTTALVTVLRPGGGRIFRVDRRDGLWVAQRDTFTVMYFVTPPNRPEGPGRTYKGTSIPPQAPALPPRSLW